LYERYVPIREIYHFGQQFLNGFTPQRMQAVRGYFDQVFEGSYAKSIPEQQRALLVQIADTKYTQETGRSANREDPLWKTYRNVEASRRYPDLWHQFRDDISASEGMSIHPTMTNSNDPDLGSQALGRPDNTALMESPNHTGHSQQQRFDPNDINQPNNAPALNIPNHTGHEKLNDDPVTHVFASTNQKNPLEPFSSLPKGPIHSSDLDLDALRNAANKSLGKGGLTKAGRALDKHAAGQRTPDSPFPALSGSNANKNETAKQQVNEILDSPDATFRKLGRGGVEVRSPDGRGVRFNQDGSFSGFID
jgi:hypothetical protein